MSGLNNLKEEYFMTSKPENSYYQSFQLEKFRVIEVDEEDNNQKYYMVQHLSDKRAWEYVCPPFYNEEEAIKYFNKIVNNEITEDGERIVAKNY